MRVQSGETDAPSSQPRSKPHTPNGAPAPLPDLFGFVPEAAPAWPTKPTTTPAEWPAGANRPPRLAPVYTAPDRPPAEAPRPPRDLSGIYARSGRVLRRADGVSLNVRDTQKDRLGPTDADRTIAVGYPGSGRPPFSSGLYDRRRKGERHPPLDDLSGFAFEHRATGRWYRFAYVAPGSYRVERTARNRRGRGGR